MLTEAYNNQVDVQKSELPYYKESCKSLLPSIDEVLQKTIKMNNNVHFQRVPQKSEIDSILPEAKFIIVPKSFALGSNF